MNILYDPSHFVLQQLDYLTYIDHYHEFIKAFHVKDSEFKPNGKKVLSVAMATGATAQVVTALLVMDKSILKPSLQNSPSTAAMFGP